MGSAPENLRYSEDHEWVRLEGDIATIGITDYAQEQLTDIVFVELPDVGSKVNAGDGVAVLESVKSVADVYCPFNGEITEVNESLESHPEKVNEDAFGEGWIFKIRAREPNLSKLMDAAAYEKFTEEGGN